MNSLEIKTSNTDSCSKSGVYCRNTYNFYLALTIRNLFLRIQKNKIRDLPLMI
jgi:hypothetical protein